MTGGPKRQKEPALHKPLLALFALSRWRPGDGEVFAFQNIEGDLAKLIREFVDSSADPDVRRPFWLLRKDKVWRVETSAGEEIEVPGSEATREILVEKQAQGRFSQDVAQELRRSDGRFARQWIGLVLFRYFEPDKHRSLLKALDFPGWESFQDAPRQEPKLA
jgi:putative restriction endonuclease